MGAVLLPVACRSQEKTEEAIVLLKESIKYGPDFADAYSSLASLLAEQVTVSISLHEHFSNWYCQAHLPISSQTFIERA